MVLAHQPGRLAQRRLPFHDHYFAIAHFADGHDVFLFILNNFI